MKKSFPSTIVLLSFNEKTIAVNNGYLGLIVKKTQKNHPGGYQGWFFFISFSLAGVRKGTSCVPHINKICFF